MKAFQIIDVKEFMKKMLLQDTFDAFRVVEVRVTTAVTYTIDGVLHPEFLASLEDLESKTEGETYTSWQSLKPFCLSIIKGPRTPLNFKIIFLLSKNNIHKLLTQSSLSISCEDITGLYLNCQYEKDSLLCTTGTSLRFFTLDKTLDDAWDMLVKKFFKQQGLIFEEL